LPQFDPFKSDFIESQIVGWQMGGLNAFELTCLDSRLAKSLIVFVFASSFLHRIPLEKAHHDPTQSP
jgi:hypothetical protein